MLLEGVLKQAEKDRVAIGHFNTPDLVQLKAVFAAAQELKVLKKVLARRPIEIRNSKRVISFTE